MEPNQISHADLLDILFEGRNKNYGAYDLRRNYNRRLTKAIAFTLSLCLLLVFGYCLAGRSTAALAIRPALIDDSLTEVRIADKKIIIPPPPAHRPPPQQVVMINDLHTRIVPDNQFKPEDRPHTVEEMNDATLGNLNRPGTPDDNTGPTGPPNGTGAGLITAPSQNTDIVDSTFRSVEIESKFKGGPEAWRRFLLRNFRTPEEALANGIQGTVIVQFVVDKTGNVSNVEAISGPEELRGEAVRVIKKSGQWEPAIQNGRHVNSYKKQPIVVLLGDNG